MRAAVVVFAALLRAAPADAHLESTGMGPVYDGVLHFLTSPEDLVATLALALLAGLGGAAHGRRMAFTLPGAWLLGGLAGSFTTATSGSPLFWSAGFLVLGGLVAADVVLPLPVLTALAALLGLAHGYLNGTGMGHPPAAIGALLGLAVGVFTSSVLVAAFVVRLRAAWARVAVRVVGSWVAASGLLLLGWAFRR